MPDPRIPYLRRLIAQGATAEPAGNGMAWLRLGGVGVAWLPASVTEVAGGR